MLSKAFIFEIFWRLVKLERFGKLRGLAIIFVGLIFVLSSYFNYSHEQLIRPILSSIGMFFEQLDQLIFKALGLLSLK